jgi:transketolase
VEAGISQGWHQWVGPQGKIIALDHFGASAPAETLFQKFGFTPEAVTGAAKSLLAK